VIDYPQLATFRFPLQGSVIINPPGELVRLTVTGSGFIVTDTDDNTEVYNVSGVLQSIRSRAGVTQTLTYAGSLWSNVTDGFGNSLSASRNASGSIYQIVASGVVTYYNYDAASRLQAVTYPDSSTRSYAYADSRFISALTAETDETGSVLNTWSYNTQGRAVTAQQAGGANAQTLSYNANSSVAVTDALGAARTFTYARIGDCYRVTAISGSQCATCSDGAAATYDAHGFVASRTEVSN
jgi:YD repeat-containing protein